VSDYDSHLASYDHLHRQRLKDLKNLQRDPSATDKARERERKEDERMGGGVKATADKKAGFKKGAFKRAFGAESDEEEKKIRIAGAEANSEDDEEEIEDQYDPRFPTD
jgi:hypothetical protein